MYEVNISLLVCNVRFCYPANIWAQKFLFLPSHKCSHPLIEALLITLSYKNIYAMMNAHDLVLSKSTLFLRSTIWFQILFLDIAGRSWSLVKNKVRKDYPSVQLTAWRV